MRKVFTIIILIIIGVINVGVGCLTLDIRPDWAIVNLIIGTFNLIVAVIIYDMSNETKNKKSK